MAQINQNTHTGNRIIVRFDGESVGLIQSVRMNDDYAPEPASGVGDIHVQEYVPTMARHNLNVSNMVLKKASLRAKGLVPENADAMLQGLVFDIEVYDKDNATLMRKYMGCSYASGDLDVQKHAIVVSNAVFNALDVSGVEA
jgi:hypothetical protein